MTNQPFSTKELGKTIGTYRKEKNLTQSELAEALYVSHQAVSSWENGLTSPDIAKLSELAKIFQLTIDELLNNEQLVATVTKVANHDSLREEELMRITAIVKPDELNKIIEEIEEPHFDIEILLALAPFIDKNNLFSYIKAPFTNISLADLVELAPFLDTRQLSQIIDYELFKEGYSMKAVAELAPFLNEATLIQLIQKCSYHYSTKDILDIAPFLSPEALSQLM